MAKTRLQVIEETETGKNIEFKDTTTGERISLKEAINRVQEGVYKDYMVSTNKNGEEYVKRKPDGNKNTNLG